MLAETTERRLALLGKSPSQQKLRGFVGPVIGIAVLATSCLTPPPRSRVAAKTDAAESVAYSGPSEAYTWKSVVINGGGFVTGLVFSPVKQGILYARTDVGGAYRYDSTNKSWLPLTDFLGHKRGHFLGIESLAVDPTGADRVYMAVGMYTAAWAATGAFMRSDDRGDTWRIFPVDFKMGGNELSRSDGERLAVDPHQTKVLYFGSRRDGLWKSVDSAETWKKVVSFPVPDDTDKGLGLPIVLFDAASGQSGKETPTLYVGTQTDGKFYRSTDAGKTWAAIPNQPTLGFPPRRAAVDKDGTLYATYALGDSPYALTKGAVYAFDPKKGDWTDITPLRASEGDSFGYGGISVDPSKPGTVIVATMDRWAKGAEIFRTLDGGKTWKPLMATAVIDGGGVAHVYNHREKLNAPQWVGDIKIDPFDANRAMLVEGGGVWATWDLTSADADKPTHFSFHSKNLEELCARDLVSPPEGAPLISVMLDACGMRHDDLGVSPAGGTFQNPACASSDDIDFAGKKPNVMVRVGSYPWDGTKGPRGAMSTDGGATWKQFAKEPARSGGLGSVAISADGAVVVWAPRDANAAFSRDGGTTWTQVAGLPPPAKSPDWAPWFLRLASDSVNPKKFYALNALTGEVLRSEDSGAHFKLTSDSVSAVPEYDLHYASIKAVPGLEGEVWITTKTELTRSSDSGQSFSRIADIQEAHGVGFGKAAPGQSFPAIYLSGKISDQTGFFRSDDGGRNFTRINDDQHQYGGATVVTGDPRVYGRVYIGPGGRGIIYGEPKK
jgi:photosystem II stability/assembly factor-like uncharacterized protein